MLRCYHDLKSQDHDFNRKCISKFLSKHSIKYDTVTVTFKVIQGQSSWCQQKREDKFLSIINCNHVTILHCYGNIYSLPYYFVTRS